MSKTWLVFCASWSVVGCAAGGVSDGGGDADADADSDADADGDVDSDADSDSDTATGTGSDTGSGSDTSTGTDTGTEEPCPGGQELCGDECVRIGSDEDNCGECFNVCDADTAAQCIGGECECGGEICGGTLDDLCCSTGLGWECTDTYTSRYNCGDCDTECTSSEDCVDGECVPGKGNPCVDKGYCDTDEDCPDSTCYREDPGQECGKCL